MFRKTQTIMHQYSNLSHQKQSGRINVLKSLSSAEGYHIAVLVDNWDYDQVVSFNNQMRIKDKGFILTGGLCLYGYIFVDFGDNHLINDPNGEKQQRRYIQNMTNEIQAQVTILQDDRPLEVGNSIFISCVKGMSEIN